MDDRERQPADIVPGLPGLLVAAGACWRTVHRAQAGVDPSGPAHAALDGVRTAVEALAHQLTGQRGFFALAVPAVAARRARAAVNGGG